MRLVMTGDESSCALRRACASMLAALALTLLLAAGPAAASDKQPLLSKLDGLGRIRYGTSIDVVLVGFEPHEQGTSLGTRARASGSHWPGETPGGWGEPPGEDAGSKQLAEWLVEGLRFDGSSLAAMLQELSHPVTMRPEGRPEWQAAAAQAAANAAWSHPSDDADGSDPEEDSALEAARVQGGARTKRAAAAAGGGEHIDALADAAAAVSAPTAGSPAAAAVDMPVALSITPNYRVKHARRSLWRAVQDVVERQLASASGGGGGGVPVLDPEALVSLLRAHHDAMGHGTSLFVLHPRIVQAVRGGSRGSGEFVSLPVEAPAGGDGTFEAARRLDDLAARLERGAGAGPGPVVVSAASYAYRCPTRGCSCNAGVDWSRRLAWIDVGAHGAHAVATHRHAGDQEMHKVFSAELQRMRAITSGGAAGSEDKSDEGSQALARSWAAPRFPVAASAVLASTGKLMGNEGLTRLSEGRTEGMEPVARGDAARKLAAWAGRLGAWLARLTEAVVASPVYAIPQGSEPEGGSKSDSVGLVASHEARVRVLVLRLDEAELRSAGSSSTTDPGAGTEGGAVSRVRWGPCAIAEEAAQRPGLDAALTPLLDASRHSAARAADGLPEEVGLAATHVTAECAVVPLGACANCADMLRRAEAAPPSDDAPVLLSGEAIAQWLQLENLRVREHGSIHSAWAFRADKGDTTRVVPAVLLSVKPDPARQGKPGAGRPAALLWDGPLAFASASAGMAVAVRTEPLPDSPAGAVAGQACDGAMACDGQAVRLDPTADVARALVAATFESGWGIRSSAAPAAACGGVPSLGSASQRSDFDIGPWDAARVRSHHRECWTASSRSVTVDTESRMVPLEPSLEVLLAAERWDGQLPFHLVDGLGRAEFLLSAQRALQPARLAVLAAAAHSRGGSSLAEGLGIPSADAERISDQMLGVEARLAEAEAELVQLHPHAARLGMELALAPASSALAKSIAVAVSRRHQQLVQDAPGCAPQAVRDVAAAEVVERGLASAVCGVPSRRKQSCVAPSIELVGMPGSTQSTPSSAAAALALIACVAATAGGWLLAPTVEGLVMRRALVAGSRSGASFAFGTGKL